MLLRFGMTPIRALTRDKWVAADAIGSYSRNLATGCCLSEPSQGCYALELTAVAALRVIAGRWSAI
jgi:hypothetical protein